MNPDEPNCVPPDAEHAMADAMLRQTIAELEDVKSSLRVSRETLDLALQSAGQFAWEIDCDTRKIKITGDPRSALGFDLPATGEEHLALVSPEDLTCVTNAYNAAMDGWASSKVEYRLISPNTGETVWVQSAGRLLTGCGCARVIGVTRNITKTKNAAVALHKSEEPLQVLKEELRHRTRNLISVVAAIANKTLKTSDTLDNFKASFQHRLGSLARVHDLLSRMTEGDRITLDALIETALSAQSVRHRKAGRSSSTDRKASGCAPLPSRS